MEGPARRIRSATLVPRGVFQLALLATGFAAWRALGGPSTFTFFLFESALAATIGIYAYTRLMAQRGPRKADGATALGPRKTKDERRQSLKEIQRGPSTARSRSSWGDPSPTGLTIVPRGAFDETKDPLQRLADEGETLLALARSWGIEARFYQKTLRMVHKAQLAGHGEEAIRALWHGNEKLRARLTRATDLETRAKDSSVQRTFLLLSSVFFVLLALSVWLLHGALYVAPPTFYLLLGAMGGALAWNIHRCGEKHSLGILAQLVALAALVKFHFFYLNPYVYASDAFFQFSGLVEVHASGHLPAELGHYYYFPGLVTFAYEGVAVGGFPLTWYGIFPLLAVLTFIPAIYLVGREIANRTVGLFASLLGLFSVFGFLSTQYTPALYGFSSLVLAVYALLKIRTWREQSWIAVFWIAALGAFFSHPISALVLGLILGLRFLYFRLSPRPSLHGRTSATPALSYGVVYGAYVAFIAATSFNLFVLTVFATTSSPPLATSPSVALRSTLLYVVQSAISPLSLALAVFLVGFGLFSTHGAVKAEHRFFALLIVVFTIFPAIEVVAENFRTQSSRFLLYLTIPMVILGGIGITNMARALPNARKTTVFVVVLFATLGFLASSTYLTSNDSRFLNGEVPALTTHITWSALASRDFLSMAKEESRIYMDFGSLFYFDNNLRAPNALAALNTSTLDGFEGRTLQAFVLINDHFLPYGNPYQGVLYDAVGIRRLLEDAQASRLFDAGEVQVYLTP